MATDKNCKETTIKLRAAPQVDLCMDSAWDVASGFLKGLQARGWGGAGSSAFRAADQIAARVAAGKTNCCDDQERDVGDDLSRAFIQVMISQRITPQQWEAMYPKELVEAWADTPEYQTGGAQAVYQAPGAGSGGGGSAAGIPRVDDLMIEDAEIVDGDVDGVDVAEGVVRSGGAMYGASTGYQTATQLGLPWYGRALGAVAGGVAGYYLPEVVEGAAEIVDGADDVTPQTTVPSGTPRSVPRGMAGR